MISGLMDERVSASKGVNRCLDSANIEDYNGFL